MGRPFHDRARPRGRAGEHAGTKFFVDSGLVAARPDPDPDRAQAAVLASRTTLAAWGAGPPEAGRFAQLLGALALGSASRAGLAAIAVAPRAWRSFGDFGGIKVDALVSWGFLKHFTWTIDFDRRVYLFSR